MRPDLPQRPREGGREGYVVSQANSTFGDKSRDRPHFVMPFLCMISLCRSPPHVFVLLPINENLIPSCRVAGRVRVQVCGTRSTSWAWREGGSPTSCVASGRGSPPGEGLVPAKFEARVCSAGTVLTKVPCPPPRDLIGSHIHFPLVLEGA